MSKILMIIKRLLSLHKCTQTSHITVVQCTECGKVHYK